MLKVAIIGAGQVARASHIIYYQEMDGVEVVAISDVNLDVARQTAKQFHIPAYYDNHIAMLEEMKPDAVSVCVPNRFHCAVTCDALEHGCHVLCEKPPGITVEEVCQMQEAAIKYGKILTFGFHFRHSARVALLKDKIVRGEFGEIYAGDVEWTRRRGIPGWGNFTNVQMQGGGALIDIGVHMLDLAVYLLDYPKVSYVCATTSDRIGRQGGSGFFGEWDKERFTVEDGLFGFIRFADGKSLNVRAAFALHIKEKERRNVQLYGSRMGCSLFPLEIYGTDECGREDSREFNITYPFEEERDWHRDGIYNFVESIRQEQELLVTIEQAVYLQRIVDGLYESAKSGKPVMFSYSLH